MVGLGYKSGNLDPEHMFRPRAVLLSHRADFLEEGSFNSTLGIASLFLWKAGATAKEGRREAKAAPRG